MKTGKYSGMDNFEDDDILTGQFRSLGLYDLSIDMPLYSVATSDALSQCAKYSSASHSLGSNGLTVDTSEPSYRESMGIDQLSEGSVEHEICRETWMSYYNLEINRDLFKKGIFAFKPYESLVSMRSPSVDYMDENRFFIGSSNSVHPRELMFSTKFKQQAIKGYELCLMSDLPNNSQLKRNNIYLYKQGSSLRYVMLSSTKQKIEENLYLHIEGDLTTEVLESYKYKILNIISEKGHIGKNKKIVSIETLLEPLKKYIKQHSIVEESYVYAADSDVIVNAGRREEIFFPLVFNNSQQQNLGFYVYPWTCEGLKSFQFSGFTRFVTAGCMFGSQLQGIDQKGGFVNLIKHNIDFHPSQVIEQIVADSAPNPYEEVLFDEFSKLLLFVNNLSVIDKPKQIYYHLPYYDYMLFGIELFNRGRMTLKALNKFFEAVVVKKNVHIDKIKSMCKSYEIECIIESPFENLFEKDFIDDLFTDFKRKQQDISNKVSQAKLSKVKLPQANSYKEYSALKDNLPKELLPAETILVALGFSSTDLVTMIIDDEQQSKMREGELVNHCLEKLKNNNFHPVHKHVWEDVIQSDENLQINNLDILFKTANAVMVAIACKGQQDYKTCTLYPISEKQIAVSYDGFYKNLQTKYPYSAPFNITVIDPALGYDPSTKGLLFYFSSSSQCQLSTLVQQQDILLHVHKNIAFSAENSDSIGLDDILPNLKIIPR